MGEIMLSVSGLVLGYGGKPVVRLERLELEAGGQCLIAGPSGCGKTTLLYALAGLILPMEGSVRVAGADITAMGEGKRDRFRGRHIGMIFQTLHLLKSVTVLENVLLASYAAGVAQDRGRALELLAGLGLADKANMLPGSLSQGQAQRVAMARAVLHGPSVILADEPTSSLDDSACETVIRLIQEVARQTQAALVISTHDSRVRAHFGRVITMGEGA